MIRSSPEDCEPAEVQGLVLASEGKCFEDDGTMGHPLFVSCSSFRDGHAMMRNEK